MLLIGAGLKNKGSLIGENDAILIRGRVSAAFFVVFPFPVAKIDAQIQQDI